MNDDPIAMLERELVGAARRRAQPRRRQVTLGTFAVAATVAVTAIVAVGAVVLLGGHSRTTTSASRPIPGRQRLIDILGVLRRPQTKADLSSPLVAQLSRHARALQGVIDLPLVRLVAINGFGKIYLIPFKPPTAAQLAAAPQLLRYLKIAHARDETLSILGGGEGFGATAAQIKRIGAYSNFGEMSEGGSGFGSANSSTFHATWTETDEWIGVVPDGVVRVVVHVPRRRGHPQPETLTSLVHGNVFAVRSSAHGTGKPPNARINPTYTWYAANGHEIRRIIL